MKITILGAAGVRTPIIVQSIAIRQKNLKIDELCLMDIDKDHLEIIQDLCQAVALKNAIDFKVTYTDDAVKALENANFVITTFRVGGMESRKVDERVALNAGVLGQETTGPGGFAMGLRTIPVLLGYIEIMKKVCPDAWLLNFANPSGMLAEVILRVAGWKRAVGICDSPSSVRQEFAKALDTNANNIFLDYFGLNHLGWIRKVMYQGKDYLPMFLDMMQSDTPPVHLPFDARLMKSLAMLPNEYLYYYYSAKESVSRILRAEQSRGEFIADINAKLFKDLTKLRSSGDAAGMEDRYIEYILERSESYMSVETGTKHSMPKGLTTEQLKKMAEEGYSGVALDIIEALSGAKPQVLILNVLNNGAIQGIPNDASVEIPVYVGSDMILPLAVGEIPTHCMGLISEVKSYERLTIEAAIEKSYEKALTALSIHPLVADRKLAKIILDGYLKEHGDYFPALK